MLLRSHLSIRYSVAKPIIAYSLIMYIFSLGDALMSYTIPVYIGEHVSNAFVMGLIFSFSSLVGLVGDFLIPKLFHNQKYKFFLVWGFISAVAFPLTLLIFPPLVPVLLFSMAIWGVYYEMETFSGFQFIHTFVSKRDHASSWGLLSSFKSAAYFIGPLIAALLIEKAITAPFYATVASFVLGFIVLLLFLKKYKNKDTIVQEVASKPQLSVKKQIAIWFVLMKKLWPLYLFTMVLSLVDAFFWTIGPLISENMKDLGGFGGLLLTIYMLPSLFMGFFAGKLAKPFGKKKISLYCGIASGILFALSGLISGMVFFMAIIFVASVFLAVPFPEISATFEDYVSRLGHAENDIIGIQSSAASISYIIGPILAGFIATLVGNQLSFSIMGIILLIVSLISLVAIPRKIHMPQTEVATILS